jgi:hypothetical protein
MGIIEVNPGESLAGEAAEPEEALPFDGDTKEYLTGIYQGRIKYDPQRVKVAIAVLPFEYPKLSVTATAHYVGFASRLEQISKAGGKSMVIDAAKPRD